MTADHDDISRLAEALYCFFEEIDRARAVCLRHKDTTRVLPSEDDTLLLQKTYRCADVSFATIAAALDRLSPAPLPMQDPPSLPPHASDWRRSWITWEAHSVFIRLQHTADTLSITLLDPPHTVPRPSPIRRVASVLRLCECLVYEYVVKPQRITRPEGERWPIQEYLYQELSARGGLLLSAVADWRDNDSDAHAL